MLNRDALRELFDYTDFTWASYGRCLGSLPPDAVTRPAAGSGWESVRQALFHIVAAWDGWICEQTGAELSAVDPQEITTWEQLDAIRSELRAHLRHIIDETPDEQLDAARPVHPGGPANAPREVVAHILLHERGHHGDISTLLSALGAEPPNSDYLVFVFARNHAKSPQERSL
jgi:uncharacterized damage-inducible protein DinB